MSWIKNRISLVGPPLLVICLLVTVWQIVVTNFNIRVQVLPSPIRIIQAGWQDFDNLYKASLITAQEGLLGAIIAAILGLFFSLAIFYYTPLARAFEPLLVVSQTIPLIAIAPLLVIWIGFGATPKVLLVVIYAIFPIIIATLEGLRSTPQELVDVALTWGKSKRWVLAHVQMRYALPNFFAGLRISTAYVFSTAALGEFVGAENGLGIYLLSAGASFRTDLVFVGATALAVMTLVFFGLVALISYLLTPYLHHNKQVNNE